MIPRIKKILYATDLTKNSAYAFRYAVNSAQKHDADIYILHVIETVLSFHGGLAFHVYRARTRLEKLRGETQT